MSKKLFSKKFIIFALLVTLLPLTLCNRKKYTKFPKIKNGQYLGKIEVKKVSCDFFLQKDKFGANIAIITPANTIQQIELSNNLNLIIPTLTKSQEPISLVGEKLNDQYTGQVFLKNKAVGKWNLKKISSEQDIQSDQGLIGELKKFHLLKTEYKSINEEISDLHSRIALYKEALPKDEKLHATAVNEADDLTYNIEEKQKARKKIIKEIKAKVTELEQLQRISALGRAIDLARRTTKREDRWYLANWGEEALESQQQVADSLGVDLSKLDEKLKLADEYINLKNSISQEARRIEELRNIKPKQIETQQPEIRVEEQKPKKKQNSIWNKIGDLFSL